MLDRAARERWRLVPFRKAVAADRSEIPLELRETPPAAVVARRDRLHRRLLVGADLVAATLALLAVAGGGLMLWSALLPALLVVTCKIVGLYDRDDIVMRRSTLREVPRLAEIAGLFALLIWLFADLFISVELNRPAVLELWALAFLGTAVLRAAARALARRASPAQRCAVIGDGPTIGRVTAKLHGGRVQAEVVASLKVGADLLTPDAFRSWLQDHRVERLLLAPVGHDAGESLDFVRLAKAAGVRVSLLPRLLEAVGSSVDFEDVDGMTVLGVRQFGMTRSSRLLKRAFDLTGVTVGLVAVAPLLLVIAAAVKLGSRGPVFFRQQRVGRDGKHFAMLKFRSMIVGADAMQDQLRRQNATDGLFKLVDDPRTTRVGRVLRATSLDELPQLLNVLRGEMSLVGPRPLVLEEDRLVSGLDRSRLHLTPGMTGPWQILGGARVPLQEMVSIDYLYVTNWSLWGDVEILVRTAAHMLRRGGL